MTISDMIAIRGGNVPRGTSQIIVSGNAEDLTIQGSTTIYSIPVRSVSAAELSQILFSRLADILPQPMSRAHMVQLRQSSPEPRAKDDPATYEYQNG